MEAQSALDLQRWKTLRVNINPSPVGTDRVMISVHAVSQVGRKQHVATLWQGSADYNHEIGNVSECLDTVLQALREARSRL